MTTRITGAEKARRHRARGKSVSIVLPPDAAEALAAIMRGRDLTQRQAIAQALREYAASAPPEAPQGARYFCTGCNEWREKGCFGPRCPGIPAWIPATP